MGYVPDEGLNTKVLALIPTFLCNSQDNSRNLKIT